MVQAWQMVIARCATSGLQAVGVRLRMPCEQVAHVVRGVAPARGARPFETQDGLRLGGHDVGLVINLNPALARR